MEPDPGGAYSESAAAEVALLAELRAHHSLQDLSTLWLRMRAAGDVEELVARAQALAANGRCDLVVELKHGGISVAGDDAELAATIRSAGPPRPLVVIDIAPRMQLVRESFDRWATVGRRPTERRVGRPPRRVAEVRELRR